MSNEDYKKERRFMETAPAIYPEMRRYFSALNRHMQVAGVWSTTTTTTTTTTSTTSTTSSTSSTTSSTSSTSSTTTTTTA